MATMTDTQTMLSATDERVTTFLHAWHENGRANFERNYDRLVYDDYAPKVAKDRRKYIACDRGTFNASGVYLIDRVTTEVYSIKAYGVPNRRLGLLADLTQRLQGAPQEIRL